MPNESTRGAVEKLVARRLVRAQQGRNTSNAFGHYFRTLFHKVDGVPKAYWEMVEKRLRHDHNEDDKLSVEERSVAVSAYLREESTRDNRVGSTVAATGGYVAASGGAWAFLELAGVDSFLAAGTGALAIGCTVVGQGAKLAGAHRDGVGVMVAAILDQRLRSN